MMIVAVVEMIKNVVTVMTMTVLVVAIVVVGSICSSSKVGVSSMDLDVRLTGHVREK